MKTITHRLAAVGLLLIGLLAVPDPSRAQTILNTLTNSVAITTTAPQTFAVSSTANVLVGSMLFWPISGELMCVTAIPSAGNVTVRRACDASGSLAATLAVTQTAIIIPPGATTGAVGDKDLGGSCTRGVGYAAYSPYINKMNAKMWVCIGSVWKGAFLKTETPACLPPFTP